MSGSVPDNDSNQPMDSLVSFEHLEGMITSQSDIDCEQHLPFDVTPSDLRAFENGFSQDESGDARSFHEEPLTNESLGADILQFDDERETSGLLNDSELLNHRSHQYDSGSCPSEDDVFLEEGLGKGSSMDLLQKYMEVTPRANTSMPDLNYASNEFNDSFGSDDAFDDYEPSHHNNNKVNRLPSIRSPEMTNQHQISNGITNNGQCASLESEDDSDGVSSELNDTMVPVGDPSVVIGSTPEVHEENYGDSPPDHKDSDSASISIGQFVPNAVNRNRLPRPLGKPVKRSTPKGSDKDLPRSSLNRLQKGSGSVKTSPRVSADGSNRSPNSSKGSYQDLSERSGHRRNKSSSSNNNGNKSQSKSPHPSESRLSPSRTPHNPRRTSASSNADSSPQSEQSKLDLSLRLEEESKTRQQADELNEQLQKNYDELLGKYAQAENTIDQLKLGARVNLYGDSPTPRQGIQGAYSSPQVPGIVNLGQPQKASIHHTVSLSSRMSGSQGGDQVGHSAAGVQTNNAMGSPETRPSSTVPSDDSVFPAVEGMLTSLAFKVKSQQDQIESFETLLQENQLAPKEQKTVLDRLKADQGQLESDYMHAKEEHNALRRRNSLINGGTEAEFDPDRTLEGEIFQLGMKLEDLAEVVQSNLRNAPPVAVTLLPTNKPWGLTNGDERFQKQSNQHTHDEDELNEADSRSKMRHHALPRGKDTKQNHLQRPTSLNGVKKNTNLHRQDPSENGLPSRDFRDNNKASTNGFASPEADSGFMGSESSRQSNQNGGSGHSGHDQVGKLRERSSKQPVGQMSPPQVTRRLPRNWESPQLSDRDISEQDEDTDEITIQSVRAAKRNSGSAGQTPATRGVGRSVDRPKQKESMIPRERLRQSKLQHPTNKRHKDYQLPKEPQRTTDRQSSERRGMTPRSSRKPVDAWSDHKSRVAVYPDPDFNYRPPLSQEDAYSSQDNLDGSSKRMTDPRRGNITRSFGIPHERSRIAPRQSHDFDTDSEVTKSSGKSEVITHLQEEIEHLRRQMSKLKSPDKPQRISPSKRERPPSPGLRKTRRGSLKSEASSNRSETLKALEAEINDLRNQVNDRDASPLTYSPPLSRESLRDPLNNYPEKRRFGSPQTDPLRETLRQTYLPNSGPSLYARTPTRSYFHSSSPSRNPVPHFESPPFVNSPPYNPEVSYRSPSPTRQSYLYARPLSSRFREQPDLAAMPSPLYASRQEPCPLCSGSGVHTHGEYTYPRDFKHSTANQQWTAGTLAQVPPNSFSNPSQYSPNPTQGILQANSTFPASQPQFYTGQQSHVNQHQVLSQPAQTQTIFGTQPRTIFSTQPIGNPAVSSVNGSLNQPQSVPNQSQPVLNQSQPALNQPQPFLNQTQPVLNQPQPVLSNPQLVLNQPQPVFNQSQPVVNQPQPVLNQSQPLLNQPQAWLYNPQPVLNQPQPVSNQTPQGPVNNNLSQAPSVQTPTPGLAAPLQTPVASYIPLVTLPVFASTPVNATQQGTSEKHEKNRKKSRNASHSKKSVGKPQDTGGTTIYITPTKQRGRYYFLDDEKSNNSGVEEYYFRRTPRGKSGSKSSSFVRASKDSRDSSMDLDEAIKMADKLSRSSRKMLKTVRSDMSKSQIF